MKMIIHPSQTVQIVLLLADKAPIKVLSEYSNYTNVFLPKATTQLLEYTKINNYAINLKNGK